MFYHSRHAVCSSASPAYSGVLALVLLACSQSLVADSLTWSVAAEYTSGDFGGSESINTLYIPVTAKYQLDDYVFRLTLPYIFFTAPAGTTVSVGGNSPMINTGTGTGASSMVQGLGDLVASATTLDVLNSGATADISLDLTAKIKFGTANQTKGLGTGVNDYTLQADVFRFYQQWTPYGSLGYTFQGEPPGVNFDNTWFAVAGARYRYTPEWGVSLDYYYRQALSAESAEQKEVTALLDFKIDQNRVVQAYVIRGLSDGSPDWGIGLMLSVAR